MCVVREASQERDFSISFRAEVPKVRTRANWACVAEREQSKHRYLWEQGVRGAGAASSCGEHAKLWAHRASHCESSESHSVTCAIFVQCFLNLKKQNKTQETCFQCSLPDCLRDPAQDMWISASSSVKQGELRPSCFPSNSPGAQPHRVSSRPPTPVTQ